MVCGIRSFDRVFFFFFQAEAGIRGWPWSGGLGNWYRRQEEIAVGEGLSLLALKIKRFFPGLLFTMVAKQP